MIIEYRRVYEDFISNDMYIDSLTNDMIALEADAISTGPENPNTVSDNPTTALSVNRSDNKSNNDNKDSFVSKLKTSGGDVGTSLNTLINKLKEMIQKFLTKLQNRAKLLVESNKGFTATLNKRMNSSKPLERITVVNYSYKPQYLKNLYNNVAASFRVAIVNYGKIITTPKDTDNLDSIPKADEVISDICSKNSSGSKPAQLFKDMRNNFRGEKKEFVYTAEQANSITTIASSMNEIQALYNNAKTSSSDNIKKFSNLANKMKTGSSEDSKFYANIVSNMGKLQNFYQSFISYHMELRLEYMLAYREITKKLYNF